MKALKTAKSHIGKKLRDLLKKLDPAYKANEKKIKNIVDSAYPNVNGNAETLFLYPKSQQAKLRIVHIGLHKIGNAGDALLFPAVRALLQKYLAPIEFTLINLRDTVTQEIINLINTHDGVIIGGGGCFFKNSKPNKLSGWQWACPEHLLKQISVPLIVFAVGYNRFRGQEEFDAVFTQNLNLLIEKSAFFSLRNSGSIEAIKKYVEPIFHNRLIFQPCPTTLLSKFYPYEKPLNGNGKILALNIPFDRSNLRYSNKETDIFKLIAEAVREIETKNWQVLLYNHLDDDSEAIKWLGKYSIFPPQLNLVGVAPGKIIRSYNYADAAIGGRGHAQMIPFGLNIPIFSLISHNKMGYFLEDIKHPEWGEEVLSPLLKDKIIDFVNSVQDEKLNNSLTEAQDLLWEVTMGNIEKLKCVFDI
jgi:polysaccharide pyruvyl transferase WcaK-like protein